MIAEGDEISASRDPRMTDPAGRLVKRLADRKLEPVAARGVADDGELLTVGRPVGPLHVFEDLPRRHAPGDARRGEPSGTDEREKGAPVEGDGHLAGGRNGKELGGGETRGTGLRALEPPEEDLHGLAVPGGRVDHRLTVGREARRVDFAASEGELTKGGRHDLAQAPAERNTRDKACCKQRGS